MMKCPQCQRENQFPGPGLCPECYRLWKDDMRARYGPGPWPTRQYIAHKESVSVWSAIKQDSNKVKAVAGGSSSGIERSVKAVIKRLEEENDSSLLTQVNVVLREVARILAYSATVMNEEYPVRAKREHVYTQAAVH